MRITEFIADSAFKRQIQSSRVDMVRYRYNDQVASGKRVQKASDDGTAFLAGKWIDDHVRKNEQFQQNAGSGLHRARTSQDALDRIGDVLISLKTLTLDGANDSKSADDRSGIASQIRSMKEELIELANTHDNGVFLFAGTQTGQKPFFEDVAGAGGVGTMSTDDPLKILVGEGTTVNTTVTGQNLRTTDEGDLFAMIQATIDALEINDGAAIRDSLEGIDAGIDHVIGLSTDVAHMIHRFDFTIERLDEQIIQQKGEVSRLVDADIVESMLNFKNAQHSYESVLAIQSRMMQTSLLNYLR